MRRVYPRDFQSDDWRRSKRFAEYGLVLLASLDPYQGFFLELTIQSVALGNKLIWPIPKGNMSQTKDETCNTSNSNSPQLIPVSVGLYIYIDIWLT